MMCFPPCFLDSTVGLTERKTAGNVFLHTPEQDVMVNNDKHHNVKNTFSYLSQHPKAIIQTMMMTGERVAYVPYCLPLPVGFKVLNFG